MKKVLMNASVASMIYKFNMNNIDILETLGYQVDVACNFGKENPMNCEEVEKFKKILIDRGIKIIETNCPRSPFAFGKMMSTYKCLKKLADTGTYEFVHTQSPIGGALCRLAFHKARKKGTRVIYTAHGFHFYKGAPLKNWLLYYSIEKICSYLTDVLITINQEDYALAKKKMRAKRIEYVPGVGIDLEKYSGHKYDKMAVRHEWAIPKGALVLVSVGELNTNKNHEVIIRALKRINLGNALYFICGTGEYEEELKRLVHNLGLDDKVRFLGYRTDIDKILCSADIFCFPSKREGLGLAAIEAMTSGLPILTSNVHGIKDYSVNGISGYSYSPMDVEGFAEGIMKLAKDETLRNVMGERNKKAVITYSLKNINFLMEKIYREI